MAVDSVLDETRSFMFVYITIQGLEERRLACISTPGSVSHSTTVGLHCHRNLRGAVLRASTVRMTSWYGYTSPSMWGLAVITGGSTEWKQQMKKVRTSTCR